MRHLGIDVGGAHIKVSDSQGMARCADFPLWQRSEQLPEILRGIVRETGGHDGLAVTMTGELADCFRTKADGVSAILDAVLYAAEGKSVTVYLNNGQWVPPQEARRRAWQTAASNWHALAVMASRHLRGTCGLLLDVGSTTTDLVPLSARGPVAAGAADPDRLVNGELVYTGVIRSPVCAIVSRLPWRGARCPVAQELFATAADVYVTLGDLAEDPGDSATADGRPLTREYARDRLARCICADRTMFDRNDAVLAAREVARHQLARLAAAGRKVLARMPACPDTIVISGCGEFLARRLAQRLHPAAAIVSVAEAWGPPVSRAATAHAVAWLADHRD